MSAARQEPGAARQGDGVSLRLTGQTHDYGKLRRHRRVRLQADLRGGRAARPRAAAGACRCAPPQPGRGRSPPAGPGRAGLGEVGFLFSCEEGEGGEGGLPPAPPPPLEAGERGVRWGGRERRRPSSLRLRPLHGAAPLPSPAGRGGLRGAMPPAGPGRGSPGLSPPLQLSLGKETQEPAPCGRSLPRGAVASAGGKAPALAEAGGRFGSGGPAPAPPPPPSLHGPASRRSLWRR